MVTRYRRMFREFRKVIQDEKATPEMKRTARWGLAKAQAWYSVSRGVDLAGAPLAPSGGLPPKEAAARPAPAPAPAPARAPTKILARPAAPPPAPPAPPAAAPDVASLWLGAESPPQATLLSRLNALHARAPAAPAAPAPAAPAATPAPPPPPPPASAQAGDPLLVLCDMNGTLVHRSKDRLAAAGRPALVANGTHYYARDGAAALVHFLLGQKGDARGINPGGRRRVVLAFYTSMREQNAKPIAKFLAGGKSVDVYERAFNKPDPSGDNAWDTMRDLPKVWAATAPAAARGFDATNTIVVDDTARKMRDFPRNVLVVPTYDEAAIARGDDDALDYLRAYVDALLDESGDVRKFLHDRPFALP